jgi:hypothetical protein
MIWTRTRRCPYCESRNVCRSGRYDIFEKIVLPLFLLRPFRCLTCEERHYDLVSSRRVEPGSGEEGISDISSI